MRRASKRRARAAEVMVSSRFESIGGKMLTPKTLSGVSF